jgi:UDP-N-acetylmuramate: L-alanyl-gamma-D-glutamyl-meso-diaminopimelate ligase
MAGHLHILGICGSFMGGIAALAKSSGFKVTGCDASVYPPMSDQLRALGIELIDGYSRDQIGLNPDLWVIGNVVTRGNPLMEEVLDRGLRYTSGPAWLAEHFLFGKWVLAVSGTHGKTTTSALLAWILEDAGLSPGFLIGGVPSNFGQSARVGAGRHFVIEADEYDTAFFDKRSKFVHYAPRTAVLNNIEFDHADIFSDLAAIEQQFHHFVRIVPASGRIVANGADAVVERVLERGCWTPVERFGAPRGWQTGPVDPHGGFEVAFEGASAGHVTWNLLGEHNRLNALAAIAAARHAGVQPARACESLARFRGVKRRMEMRGVERGVTVFDDFAHHPTAIATTLAGVRAGADPAARVLAVLEPRSNTMKLGTMKAQLSDCLAAADRVFVYRAGLAWDPGEALAPLGDRARCFDDLDALAAAIARDAASGDQVVVMSNGGFGGIHERILECLRARAA